MYNLHTPYNIHKVGEKNIGAPKMRINYFAILLIIFQYCDCNIGLFSTSPFKGITQSIRARFASPFIFGLSIYLSYLFIYLSMYLSYLFICLYTYLSYVHHSAISSYNKY